MTRDKPVTELKRFSPHTRARAAAPAERHRGMTIYTLAPWAGGKRKLALRIVELLGEHSEYYELFLGGGSILPRKPRSAVEVVNDLNPKAIGVLEAIRDHGEKLSSYFASMEFDREHFDNAVDELRQNPGNRSWTIAAAQLVAWWMGPNGLAGTKTRGWFADRVTTTGGSPRVRWESFKRSLPLHSERLQGVQSLALDFRKVLERIPDRAGVAVYVDPPYLAKSFKYELDFAPQDHAALAAGLDALRRARIVVSYYDDPQLEVLYPRDRWRRVEIEGGKASASAVVGAKPKRATELLLINDGGN